MPLDVHPRLDYLDELVLGLEPLYKLNPMPSLKGWPGKGRLSNEGDSSPNMISIARSCYLGRAALGNDKSNLSDAIRVKLAYYKDMEKAGHWCYPRGGSKGGRAVEFGTVGHSHHHLNAETFDWWCCHVIGSKADELRLEVEKDLRIQSALMNDCRYISSEGKNKGKARFLTPGARNRKKGNSLLSDAEDDCFDRWGRWVIDGKPSIPKNIDAFYTALHALGAAIKLKANVKVLKGDWNDLHSTFLKFLLSVVRKDEKTFVAWVEDLGDPFTDNILSPCYLVGARNGVPFFVFGRDQAIEEGNKWLEESNI